MNHPVSSSLTLASPSTTRMTQPSQRRLALFCGSKIGHDPIYSQAAVQTANALVNRGIGIVYGGGNIGLMGVVADAVLAAGGEIIGVIPDFMVRRELAHPRLTRLELVASMHERKARMAELADGFLAVPGGYGTLDELFEIITWAQIRLHEKPIGILNINGYFDSLLAWLNRAVLDGFVTGQDRRFFHANSDLLALLEILLKTSPDTAIDSRLV
jgi:uncharacterized protein (TIGR00730 family)